MLVEVFGSIEAVEARYNAAASGLSEDDTV